MPKPSSDKFLLLSVRADYGGGPEHILAILRGLGAQRSFIIGAPKGQKYSERFSSHGKLVVLPHRRFSFSSFFSLAKIIRSEDVALIHSHGKGAGVYGRLLGWVTRRPVIHTFHGFHYRHLSWHKRNIYLLLERIFARLTNVLINVSVSEQSSCVEAGILGQRGSVVIPNGVAVSRDWNKAARPDRSKVILISVARHDPEKGTDKLILVARELSRLKVDFNLWLVGDGEQSLMLKQQVQNEGLAEKVHFMGFRDDVPKLLRKADIFVSASHGEGMPLSVLEAMAAGLPSVISDVVGNRDVIVNGETGFLFPLDQPEVAAQSIARLASDADLFAHCSRTAHARALELYSVEVMCERIAEVYDSVNIKKD